VLRHSGIQVQPRGVQREAQRVLQVDSCSICEMQGLEKGSGDKGQGHVVED
jgi:hypothetical protein